MSIIRNGRGVPARHQSIPVRRLFVLAAIVLLLPMAALAQRDFSKVEIKAQEAGPGVFMLTGAGGNMAVCVGKDGTFLVDDQFAPLSDRILAAIRNISDKPVRFVVNTHHHPDHVGGNENMAKTGAIIFAQDNVRRRMSVAEISVAFHDTTPASPEDALPIVTFTDSVSFHVNGQEISVTHVGPAHTDGDAVIYFRGSNVLHTGDVYFSSFYPLIDVEAGGSIRGMIAATDQIMKIAGADTRIIPGHGPISNRNEMAAYRDMLQGVADQVQKAIDAGMSRVQTVASKPTAAWDAKWGGGFLKPDTFAGIVFDDLSRRGGTGHSAAPGGGTETAGNGQTGDATAGAAQPADHIQVQHILIGFTGSVPGKNITRTQEQAKALAYQILEQTRAGAVFDFMVKKWTDDAFPGIYGLSNFKVPPAQGEYAREKMVAAFGNVGFSIKPGEIGIADYDPKTSPFGWHVIKRLK